MEAAGLFTRGSAFWTTARGVGEPAAGEKLLFAGGEDEFLIAIATIQCLICQYFLFLFSIYGEIMCFLYCALLPLAIFSGHYLSEFLESNTCTLQYGPSISYK